MRTGSEDTADQITLAKEAGARVTFRKTLPVFEHHALTDSLGLTNAAWIDACNYYPGLLRVTSVGNVLYTQYVTDIHGAWPAWTNTGIALYAGSRPAVDNGYVWYQIPGGGIYYRVYSNFSSAQFVRNMPGAVCLAPLSNRAYALWQRNAGAYEIVSMNSQESSQYTVYGLASLPRVDVVSLNGKEYFYTTDRDAGRIIEIQHVGNAVSGKDSYGVGKAIIPIDAFDDVYGLKMGYASVIDEKVVVTGRLTRTSDDEAVSMDVYAAGPEYFSFGREMFIQGGDEMNGKMLRLLDELIVSGATGYYLAKATSLFGGTGHPDLEITTSDLSSFQLTEAETRSTNVGVELSTELDHAAIAPGSDVELEMAYNDYWTKLTTCVVDADQSSSDEQGQSRVVSGVGKSAKRLAQWSPDQGVYIPSQAKTFDFPAQMTKVVRAAGRWEKANPEDEDSSIQLEDLNKLGVLYSTARASRGGTMRGKFFCPSNDGYFKPYYGVAVNYYRESAVEAATRLGVEVTDLEDDMFGHNGIVAIYSRTEHNGAEGIALYLWQDSVLTKLTSVSQVIPVLTWHWLQIEFVEGEIRVKYRTASNATFTEVIAYQYNNATFPWKRETLGRGAILVKNIVPETTCYPIGADDYTVGVDDNAAFPASGTLRIDDEEMYYEEKSSATPPASFRAFPLLTWERLWVNDVAFPNLPRIGIDRGGFDVNGYYPGPILTGADNAYNGLAMVMLSSMKMVAPTGGIATYSLSGGRTFRIQNYDRSPLKEWQQDSGTYPSGWLDTQKGDLSFGEWITIVDGAGYPDAAIYLADDLASIYGLSDSPVDYTPRAAMILKKAFHVADRGVNSTVNIAHLQGKVYYSPGKHVQVLYAASFSQDEDQSIEDALKTIVGLAGGKATCQEKIGGVYHFQDNDCVVSTLNDHKNFIASLELPAIANNYSTGMCFRSETPFRSEGTWPTSDSLGYYLALSRAGTAYFLDLYDLFEGGTMIERVPIRPANLNGAGTANVPVGTLKISVQDNLFSVWLNGRYLHTFQDTRYAEGKYVGFTSGQDCSFQVHLSAMDDILADVVVGTRGNGMSVLSELLADRHILWREDPDGSMYFYKTRDHVGTMPDIISSVSKSQTDAVISRIRAEGLGISEIADLQLLKDYGNTFATVNARYANDVGEAREEAGLLIDENWRDTLSRKYSMVPHPGLQPGDAATFQEEYSPDMIVRSQSISIGFSGNGFVCEMQCDVVPMDREE